MVNDPSDLVEVEDFKKALSRLLKNNICSITFVKKDGSKRVMRCTLRDDVVVPHEKKTDRVKEPKPQFLPAWDLEKEAWRTITVSNVTRIDVE